jgi:hypothetical protein
MALTLIKEDGTGLAAANSYASADDGDSYHEGHTAATAWTGATTAKKEAALVMATRVIDACFRFPGARGVLMGRPWSGRAGSGWAASLAMGRTLRRTPCPRRWWPRRATWRGT